MKHVGAAFLSVVLMFPIFVYAFMVVVPDSGAEEVIISDQSVQIYGELVRDTNTYRFTSDHPWVLSVRLLVPLETNRGELYNALIIDEERGRIEATLEPGTFPWERYIDPLTQMTFLRGPKLEKEMQSGTYLIIVGSSGVHGKYVLELGDNVTPSLRDLWSAFRALPRLYPGFFDRNSAAFILSPLGGGMTISLVILGMVLGFALRQLLRLGGGAKRMEINIGNTDRFLRLAIGCVCFIVAIFAHLSPVLLLVSGFCFYETSSKWCGFFALTGKRTCPADA